MEKEFEDIDKWVFKNDIIKYMKILNKADKLTRIHETFDEITRIINENGKRN